MNRLVKKTLRGALIGFSCVVVLFLALLSGLIWIIFTPEKLTPIVRQELNKMLLCESEIGAVELTFFRSFPQVELRVAEVVLLNDKVPGAPSDTLAAIGELECILNMRALLFENALEVSGIRINSVQLTAYNDSCGVANYAIWNNDTTAVTSVEENFEIPFRTANVNSCSINDLHLKFIDDSLRLSASLQGNASLFLSYCEPEMKALCSGSLWGITLQYDTVCYLQEDTLSWKIPLQGDSNALRFSFDKARIVFNQDALSLSGSVAREESGWRGDGTFSLDELSIAKYLKRIPQNLTQAIDGVEAAGRISCSGNVEGVYTDSLHAQITMMAQLTDGSLRMKDFPLPISGAKGVVRLKTDLCTDSLTEIFLESFEARTPQSALQVSGAVSHLFTDPLLSLSGQGTILLEEMQPFVPDTLPLTFSGKLAGNFSLAAKLSLIEQAKYDSLSLSSSFNFFGLACRYDSLSLQAEKGKLSLLLPASKKRADAFARIVFSGDAFQVQQEGVMCAALKQPSCSIEISNPLQVKKNLSTTVDFRANEASYTSDSIHAALLHPVGKIKGRLHSTSYDLISADGTFSMQELSANCFGMGGALAKPEVAFSLKKEKSGKPEIAFTLRNEAIAACMDSLRVGTAAIEADVQLTYDASAPSMALQWSPYGKITLKEGCFAMGGVDAPIVVPAIALQFTPQEYRIEESRMRVGNSDFSLRGRLWNVASYLRGDSLLSGDFAFASTQTDVNELMELTSGLGSDEPSSEATPGTSTPFMVPKGISVRLSTDIDRALVGLDTARQMTGLVTVRDGNLTLEDMRFATSVARMELTALYRTPRKNHLFAGIDYHMYDVEIGNLLKLLPDLDSIMPMLRSFRGEGEFHMAVETYLDSCYQLKPSTLRGAASIQGQNLTLMDGETFSEIAKKLHFKKSTENKIDSLSAEFTIYKEEIDVYPFLMVLDKYNVVIGGRHNLDMSFDYNIALVKSPLPFRIAVDVSGNLDKMKFRLAKCKYPEFYRPVSRKSVSTSQLELRKLIRNALMGTEK